MCDFPNMSSNHWQHNTAGSTDHVSYPAARLRRKRTVTHDHGDSNDSRNNEDSKDQTQQLELQEKWQILVLVAKQMDPKTQNYPVDVYSTVAHKLGFDEKTVRRVQQEYYNEMVRGNLLN